jgi:hypothetical protein
VKRFPARGFAWGFLAAGLFLPALSHAQETSAPGRVILVTLDGVRPQEFFGGPDPELVPAGRAEKIFEKFWKDVARHGVVLGAPGSGMAFEVSNPTLVSLPAYQAILAGANQPCRNNQCGRIGVETFFDRAMVALKLDRHDAAVFASWGPVAIACESRPGTLHIDAGIQRGDTPLSVEAREDRFTWDRALLYWMRVKPRALYISFNDSDEWGHRDNYPEYLASLRRYDAWIKELADLIESSGEKNVSLIVTTDHGRGKGKKRWNGHGILYPEARPIWLFVMGPWTPRLGIVSGAKRYDHLNLRPTLELFLGLSPCQGCREPIAEVTSGNSRPI